MATRAQHRAAFLLKVSGLSLGTGVTVGRWRGVESVFAAGETLPYVGVGSPPAELPRAVFGDLLEVGAATYERELRLAVYVATETTVDDDAEDLADSILEALEIGLAGQALSTGPLVEPLPGGPGSEACLVRELAHGLYVQIWRIREVFSR